MLPYLPSLALRWLPGWLLALLRTLPARLVLALAGSSSMARWVEEAWVEVPCVDVPRDFLTTGGPGSRSSSWDRSCSWRPCWLSFTMLLWAGEGEGAGVRETDGDMDRERVGNMADREGRESCRSEGREKGKTARAAGG